MDIKLKYINLSNSSNKENIVFFQKNAAASLGERDYAWKVIRACGYANFHPFLYPTDAQLSASDSYGNFTPLLTAVPGNAYQVAETPSGNELSYSGRSPHCREIQMLNNLRLGAVNANLIKASRLLCRKTAIAPGQKAVFVLKPTLFVGVASQVTEGQSLDAAVISSINTEFSLLGVASADIVLTGGGPGPEAGPYQFPLENVGMA